MAVDREKEADARRAGRVLHQAVALFSDKKSDFDRLKPGNYTRSWNGFEILLVVEDDGEAPMTIGGEPTEADGTATKLLFAASWRLNQPVDIIACEPGEWVDKFVRANGERSA